MSKNKRRLPLPPSPPEPEPESEIDAAAEADPGAGPAPENEAGQIPEDRGVSRFSSAIKNWINGLPAEKSRRIAGFLCLFTGLLLFLSLLSHFFYWWIDYDVVQQMQNGSIWANNDWQVRNIGGKLGAYTAFVFVNSGFGIASFIFPLVLFLAGLQILRIKKFRWIKIFFRSIFALLWVSILFGSIFQSGSNYVFGGSVGCQTSLYLKGLLGTVGLILLLIFSLLCYLILNYNFRHLRLPSIRTRKEPEIPVSEDSDLSGNETQNNSALSEFLRRKESEEAENDFSTGMTLSSRIGLERGNASESEASLLRQTSAEPFMESSSGNDLTCGAESENHPDIQTINTNEPELTINNTISESSDNNDMDRDPKDGTDNGNDEMPEPETCGMEDMKVIDTRTLADTKASAPPVPAHFGLDTPFDPKLELSDYKFPSIDLLEDFGDQSKKIQDMNEELLANKKRIVDTLQNYGISISKISATIGPTVTLYEIVPAPGVRISKIKNLEDDIALSLSALGIRIIAPIPGKGTIGIEVPNSQKQIVPMRDMLTCEKFRQKDLALPIALGKTISNEVFVTDLAKMPHLLVAGATGQGKSVGLNAIIASLLYSKHPAELKFVMVDPKKVELSLFNKIERHYLAKLPDSEEAIITDTRKVIRTLNSLCIEMDSRYDLLKDAGAKNLKEYNKKFISRRLNPEDGHRFLPYIVLIIDEFADLIMTAGKEIEQPIARLAQLARAIGIHLVIATQRPSVNIITGLIKANFPARIAFKVSQKIDSRTILDASGADQLIGRGDMLISMGEGLIRLQCAFIDTPEIERITEFIGSQRAYPHAYLLPECPDEATSDAKSDMSEEDWDPMFREAAELVVSTQQGSTSMLQRKFKLGYNRAGRIMDQLENAGIVGAFDGKKTREVKIKDPEALEHIFQALSVS